MASTKPKAPTASARDTPFKPRSRPTTGRATARSEGSSSERKKAGEARIREDASTKNEEAAKRKARKNEEASKREAGEERRLVDEARRNEANAKRNEGDALRKAEETSKRLELEAEVR